MGQAEVIEVLEKSKVPLSSKEIAIILKDTECKINYILNRLYKYNEIEIIELNKELAMKFYKCKRRMRLYYL